MPALALRLGVALASSLLALGAAAQPSLKMMIPANPGGGWDQTGRNLAALDVERNPIHGALGAERLHQVFDPDHVLDFLRGRIIA